jgi:hypothetical protein
VPDRHHLNWPLRLKQALATLVLRSCKAARSRQLCSVWHRAKGRATGSILCGSDFSVRILVPRFQPLDSLVQLLWSVPYLPRADRFRQRRNFERDERSEEASDLRGEDDVVLGELGGLRVAAAGAMPDEDLEPLGVRLNLRLPLAQSDHGAVEHKGYMRHSQSWSST